VQLVWSLDVEEIRAAAHSSGSQQEVVSLYSECLTPPLGGVAFQAKLEVNWDADERGSRVGLFAVPQNVPQDTFFSYSFLLTVPSGYPEPAGFTSSATSSVEQGGLEGYGFCDFFGLGAMAGGWDEAAWAAKGLPTSGQLPITLTVHGAPVPSGHRA